MEELRDLAGAERDAYFRGVHPIWGGGLSEDRFVAFQRRLAEAGEAGDRHRLIGLFDGTRLLAAMKAYDLLGSCAANPLRILGIGAVFTPPPLRRRGHARRMLELAIAEYAAHGAQAAILFSDIGTAYYERLGFRALRSEECMVDPSGLPRSSSHAAASADEAGLSRLLARSRAKNGDLTLARDGWVLRFQLRRLRELARARGAAEPEWGIAVRDGAGEEGAAMVRMARDAIDLLDAGWTSEGARDALLGRLREILLRSGRHRLRLWPSHQLRGLFPAQPRASALAMVAPLGPDVTLSPPGARADLALLDHI